MPAPPRPMLAKGTGAKPRDRFPVHFESGVTQVPLYDRAALGAGDTIAGPAIVSQLDATTLVLPGWSGEVHPSRRDPADEDVSQAPCDVLPDRARPARS